MPDAARLALERVLFVAPTPTDAALTQSILADAKLACHVCSSLADVAAQFADGAGAILLTDTVLASADERALIDALNRQPAWSDVPVLLLSSAGADSDGAAWAMAGVGNVTVLERPVRVTTLVSALKSAIRARRRQYQLRDRVNELERTDASLREQTQRLRLLWEAAAVLLSTDEPAAKMRTLFERIARHFGVDAYVHYTASGSSNAITLESCAGVPQGEAQAVASLDLPHDPIAPLMARHGMYAYAFCPLVVGGRLLGALSFASRAKEHFEAQEVEILRTIAHYVAVANERVRLIRELRDTDRRKDEFLATLAHELRNPLAPIGNAVQIMQLSADDETAQRARATIERQVRHMVRLIDDLLDVSRITRGKFELRKERVDLAAVVRNALETARPLIEAAGHEIAVTLPSEPILLDADPVRLAQVVANLLNNAAKYSDRGGRIVVDAQHDESGIALRVRDSGIGIPREALPAIFDMFMQVDRSLGRSQGGLGIGLTLVKRLVEMHGGRVDAYSDGIGKGSEFVVHLPEAADAPARAVEQRTDEGGIAKGVVAQRILVAEDNADAAQSMGEMLRLMGNDVRVVADGEAAVEEAAAFRPHVVLLDIGMPRLDGYETAARIRRTRWGEGMLLVALTGWGQEEDKRKAMDAGFDAHFTKPISMAALSEFLTESHGGTRWRARSASRRRSTLHGTGARRR